MKKLFKKIGYFLLHGTAWAMAIFLCLPIIVITILALIFYCLEWLLKIGRVFFVSLLRQLGKSLNKHQKGAPEIVAEVKGLEPQISKKEKKTNE